MIVDLLLGIPLVIRKLQRVYYADKKKVLEDTYQKVYPLLWFDMSFGVNRKVENFVPGKLLSFLKCV